jgi:uncharacterized protein (TIGR00730 family)
MADLVNSPFRRVAVYCGSSPGNDPAFLTAARNLGEVLADEGIGVVYGGGHVGLMGVVADAAMSAGGEVIGVITSQLMEREVGHHGLTELIVVESMHERKLAMSDRADAFIAMPGGVGTLEEMFEVFTWTQLGIHQKPVGLLDVDGFFDDLIAFIDHTVAVGFVAPASRSILKTGTEPRALLADMATWTPVGTPKVMGPEAR